VRTYIVKRLLLMIPTLVGMTFLTYAIVRLAPGDPVEAMIRNQSGNIDPKAMRASADRIRERLGLNDINFWGADVQSHLEALKSTDLATRVRAAQALRSVTGLDINATREVWELWWNNGKLVLSKVEPLLEGLKSTDEAKRTEAAAKLKAVTEEIETGVQTTTGQPIALAATPEQWAAWAEQGNKLISEAEPLIWQLRSPDEDDRAKAAAELKRITGRDFTDHAFAWNAWWAANKYAFTKDHLIDPAEKVANVLYGYLRWMTHVLTGDLGESIVFRMPKTSPIVGYLDRLQHLVGSPGLAAAVEEMKQNGSKNPLWIIMDRIPVTFTLNVIAEFIIFIVAIPIGLAAARYQGRWLDRGSSYVLLALYSVPAVLAGSLLLTFLARGGLGLGWFPVGGMHGQEYEKLGLGGYFLDLLHHAALPVTCMVYGGFAYLAKFARASLLENLRADYVRTARAKGLSERRVVYYHAFRNSLLPMITIMVLILPGLLGGGVVVETIFSIQGTGILLVSAAQAFDLSVIMSDVLLYGVLTLFFLLVGDILYAWADPRVRYE